VEPAEAPGRPGGAGALTSGVIYVEIGSAPAAMEEAAARTIARAAERASGLEVRVGVADGKFQAYVAAVLEASP
jgi:hypothetical protein